MNYFDQKMAICGICGSSQIIEYNHIANGLIIHECSGCKILFLNPQYSDAFLSTMYSSYTQDQSTHESKINRAHLACLFLIEKHAPAKDFLLDIGCGNGHLIALAKKRGWDPIGYDVDPMSVKETSQKTGVKTVSGDFMTAMFGAQSFSAITMLHVIEHLKSPNPYLMRIKQLLRPDGILFLALPNIRSRSATLKHWLEKSGIKRKNTGSYYDAGHHLYYYTPKTIKWLLEFNGFEVKCISDGKILNKATLKAGSMLARNPSLSFLWSSTMCVVAKKPSGVLA